MAGQDESDKPGTALAHVRYTDREVAQILRRAVALQEKHGAGTGRGLSLEEMKEVAREVGVEARFVVEAAQTLTHPGAVAGNRLLGGPVRINAAEVIEQPFRMDQMAAVIEEVRRVTGQHGRASQITDAIEWYGKDSLGATHVSVSRAGEQTRVRVMRTSTDAVAALYGAGGSIGLMATGVLGGLLQPLGAAAVVAGVAGAVGASLLALRGVWSWYARRNDQRVRSMLASVTHILRAGGDLNERKDGDD
jgi:hypothetical protein